MFGFPSGERFNPSKRALAALARCLRCGATGSPLCAADVYGRRVLHERLDAGHLGYLWAKILDHLVHGKFALAAWLHAAEKEGGVSGRKKRSDARDSRMGTHDLRNFVLVRGHGFE